MLIYNEIEKLSFKDKISLIKVNLSEPSDEKYCSIGDSNKLKIVILTDRDYEGKTLVTSDCINKMKKILSLIREEDYLICNVDDNNLLRHLTGVKCHLLTFGYNSKAQLTTSSTGDSMLDGYDYLCSLQSSVKAINEKIYEPGEIKIQHKVINEVYPVLAYCGFLLVMGIKMS